MTGDHNQGGKEQERGGAGGCQIYEYQDGRYEDGKGKGKEGYYTVPAYVEKEFNARD